MIVSDDEEPRKVTFCGEATTGENKTASYDLKTLLKSTSLPKVMLCMKVIVYPWHYNYPLPPA